MIFGGGIVVFDLSDIEVLIVLKVFIFFNVIDKFVILMWIVLMDNKVVVGYKVYWNGIEVGFVLGIIFIDSGLIVKIVYFYIVKVYDVVGNFLVVSLVLIVIMFDVVILLVILVWDVVKMYNKGDRVFYKGKIYEV